MQRIYEMAWSYFRGGIVSFDDDDKSKIKPLIEFRVQTKFRHVKYVRNKANKCDLIGIYTH